MSKWRGQLYVNVYDQTDKEINGNRLPTWCFYIPGQMEPGVMKVPAAFARAKISKDEHKFKSSAPHRPSRSKTSQQFLVGTFDPVDRSEIVSLLSTTKLEEHDPESLVREDPSLRNEAYSQIYVNKCLRALDILGKTMTWDAKGIRGLQEQPYKGKPWKMNFTHRSLAVFADPKDGGEKHFYRYGKKGEPVQLEKGPCASCVGSGQTSSRHGQYENAMLDGNLSQSAYPTACPPQYVDEEEEEDVLNDYYAPSEASTYMSGALRPPRRHQDMPDSPHRSRQKNAGPAGVPFGAPRIGSSESWDDNQQQMRNPYNPGTRGRAKQRAGNRSSAGKRQREQWHARTPGTPGPHHGHDDELVAMERREQRERSRLQRQREAHEMKESRDREAELEGMLALQQRQNPRFAQSPLLAQPQPQRPAPHLLQRDRDGRGHAGMGSNPMGGLGTAIHDGWGPEPSTDLRGLGLGPDMERRMAGHVDAGLNMDLEREMDLEAPGGLLLHGMKGGPLGAGAGAANSATRHGPRTSGLSSATSSAHSRAQRLGYNNNRNPRAAHLNSVLDSPAYQTNFQPDPLHGDDDVYGHDLGNPYNTGISSGSENGLSSGRVYGPPGSASGRSGGGDSKGGRAKGKAKARLW